MRNRIGWTRAFLVTALLLGANPAHAQGGIEVKFTPFMDAKAEPRPAPAVATLDESGLAAKGYRIIGTIRVTKYEFATEVKSQNIKLVNSTIFQKAAEAGGDLVFFTQDGVEITKEVAGKPKKSSSCAQYGNFSAGDGRGGVKVTQVCTKYDTTVTPGDTYEDHYVVSEGTVWRNDRRPAADIAQAVEAAREAARRAQSSKESLAALHEKLSKGEYAGAESLLANGADVNARDEQGWSLLAEAALHGQRTVAELLLTHGADVNAKEEEMNGQTPLHIAAGSGNNDVAEVLLAHGADVNAKEDNGQTPLFEAASAGRRPVVELLLAHGADVNAKNNGGQTPLFMVVLMGDKPMVELLLAKGADVNATSHNYETPLDWARRKDIAKLLREHGAHK